MEKFEIGINAGKYLVFLRENSLLILCQFDLPSQVVHSSFLDAFMTAYEVSNCFGIRKTRNIQIKMLMNGVQSIRDVKDPTEYASLLVRKSV